jgi:hypothetical protein
MADEKKPSYQLAYDERMKQIDDSIKSEHHGAPPSREQDTEVRPSKDSIQLGEGSHR